LMMSSCCTLRLKRRNALSIDSPSWIFTSAKTHTPSPAEIRALPWILPVWATL
jgi:hypothetical protein